MVILALAATSRGESLLKKRDSLKSSSNQVLDHLSIPRDSLFEDMRTKVEYEMEEMIMGYNRVVRRNNLVERSATSLATAFPKAQVLISLEVIGAKGPYTVHSLIEEEGLWYWTNWTFIHERVSQNYSTKRKKLRKQLTVQNVSLAQVDSCVFLMDSLLRFDTLVSLPEISRTDRRKVVAWTNPHMLIVTYYSDTKHRKSILVTRVSPDEPRSVVDIVDFPFNFLPAKEEFLIDSFGRKRNVSRIYYR